VQVKLAFLIRVLEVPPGSVLAAPRLFFNKSIMETLGPRLSFIRDCVHHKAHHYSLSTFFRNSDPVRQLQWLPSCSC
jgi:hypothetical protein